MPSRRVKWQRPTVLMCITGGSDCRSSKEFLEAGKKRLAGDTTREATAPEVNSMKTENEALKQLVAELSRAAVRLENRLLKKRWSATAA